MCVRDKHRACMADFRGSGFTLLEVAVAMAVLGLVLVTMMQVISGGLTLQYKAGKLGRAVVTARALMDELVTEAELRDGVEESDDASGLRWRRTVRRATPEEGSAVADSELGFEQEHALRFLEVVIAWNESGKEKTYAVQSLRVAPEVE
jgi:prepilin-type N-terminal cleavage/methylation domain-containing protein